MSLQLSSHDSRSKWNDKIDQNLHGSNCTKIGGVLHKVTNWVTKITFFLHGLVQKIFVGCEDMMNETVSLKFLSYSILTM